MTSNAQSAPALRIEAEDKPWGLGISYDTLQTYLYGKDEVHLTNKNGRKRSSSVPTGTNRGVEPSPLKTRRLTASPEIHSTYAARSFPPEVQLCTSSLPGVKHGVCAKQHIPSGTWIGPYEGKLLAPTDLTPDMDASYLWEIHEKGRLIHYIDGSDENSSSWMRFIACARHPEEQNMYAFQFCGSIFYRAFKDISIGTEILVYYDVHYPQFLGIPLGLKDIKLITTLGVHNTAPHQNSPVIPVLSTFSMDGGEDVPGHQPSFSPVADDAESENRQSLVSLPFGTVVVDFDETQQAQPTAHPRHSQNSDQPPFCPPHQFNQPHAMNTTKQNSTRLHHLPRRRQQHENLPENVQQQQPQRYVSERLYNQQQEIQPQDQLRRQHMGNDQPRAPPHHRQHHYQLHRQPSWPQSSFPNANSGETNGYANHTAPSTAPPLRSLPQPEMSTQQTTPWANPRYRTPERHPKDNGRILAPPRAAQPIPISSTPSRFPAAVTSSTPNTPARNTMPYPSHPLKSAHVKPFHVNNNSKLTGTDDSNREGFIGKPTASPGVHVPANQGHQDEEVRKIDKGIPLSTNETQGTKQRDKHNRAEVITIGDKSSSSKDPVKQFDCKRCQKTFADRSSFTFHPCSHRPEKPFKCGHCSWVFSSSSELREHMSTHGTEKSFRCGFCARFFVGATTLKNHMRMHTGRRESF